MAVTGSHRVSVRVRGTLDPAWWSARFGDLAIQPDGDGTTRLTGAVEDQAALHGLLATIRDLGLSLVSVDTRATAGEGRPAADHPTRGDAS